MRKTSARTRNARQVPKTHETNTTNECAQLLTKSMCLASRQEYARVQCGSVRPQKCSGVVTLHAYKEDTCCHIVGCQSFFQQQSVSIRAADPGLSDGKHYCAKHLPYIAAHLRTRRKRLPQRLCWGSRAPEKKKLPENTQRKTKQKRPDTFSGKNVSLKTCPHTF